MRILIVEDEPPIAQYLAKRCRAIHGPGMETEICYTLDQAQTFLQQHPIDLCFLDLNLNGENGFDLLQRATASPNHTIVISAYTDQAYLAYQYGVLDFIGKPFEESRLAQTFHKYRAFVKSEGTDLRFLTFKKKTNIAVLPLAEVIYFKAADIYVEAHLSGGGCQILDKTMDRLEQLLPKRFFRIHRSYLVDINFLDSFGHLGNSRYGVCLKNGETLPLSRRRNKALQEHFRIRSP